MPNYRQFQDDTLAKLSVTETKILLEFVGFSARPATDPQVVEDHLLSSLTFALHATKQAC